VEPVPAGHDPVGLHLEAPVRGLGAFKNQIVDGSAAILISMVLVFNLGARLVGRLLTRKLTAA